MLPKHGSETSVYVIRYYNTSRLSLQLVPDQPLSLPSRPLLYKAGMGQGYLGTTSR